MTRLKRIVLICAAVWLAVAMLAAAFFGRAAVAQDCETPIQFIKGFEATHAKEGDVSIAFNDADTGTIPGKFEHSDPQRYEWIVQMRITYRDDDGVAKSLSLWTVYYTVRGREFCPIKYTAQFLPLY